MEIFFGCFLLKPLETSAFAHRIEGAKGYCWVRAHDAASASLNGTFKIKQYGWQIVGVEQAMVAVTRAHFVGKDRGEVNFDIANAKGLSLEFNSWAGAKQVVAVPGAERLEHGDHIDMAKYLAEHRSRQENGECLHYDAGSGCDYIIHAHSIQKQGALSRIAHKGEIYTLSGNIGDLSKRGMFSFSKKGIKPFSTFKGFCKRHDNELFAPIDDCPFAVTDEQIFLYAYRALSREIFLKKRSVEGSARNAIEHRGTEAARRCFQAIADSSTIGLNNLVRQKEFFDRSLTARAYSDIQSAVFISKVEPSLVFSSVLFPDYGFAGEQLQDLGAVNCPLDLITFSFVPMADEWAFLFAWHRNSSRVCVHLLRTLAKSILSGARIEDALFRFVILNSENIAFSPIWWESKPFEAKEAITEAATYGANPLSALNPTYLTKSLERISDWNFESVISRYATIESD